jgi:poly(3-hydroxybutyrate) depolymerase
MSSERLAAALGVVIALVAQAFVGCGAKHEGEQHTPISAVPGGSGGAVSGGGGIGAPNGAPMNGGPPGGGPAASGSGGNAGAPAGASGASGGPSTMGGSSGSTSGSGGNAADEDGGLASDAGTDVPDAAVETCDKIPPSSMNCAEPLAPGDARKCSLQLGLDQRSYYLYAPKTYNPCKPTALIIDCHGAMETAEAQAGIDTLHTAQTSNGPLDYPGIGSGWRLEADTPEGGFIVVTPQGIGNVWTSLNNDPQFFLDIVTATKKIANIDNAKVYMTGISNGSLISYETACAHTDVFSGIAAFSAGQNCSSLGKPIPVISFDAEPDFAYSTTVSASDTMVSLNKCKGAVNPNWLTIDSSTTDTVCRNDPFDTHPTLVPCSSITKTTITDPGIEPTVCKRWDDCNGGVAVVFCDVAPSTLHGSANAAVDAHILYGNATSLNMPSVAWRFFKSFWK